MMNLLQQQIKRQMALGGYLVIGLDTDTAGREALPKIAETVLAAEIKPTLLKVAEWPEHDVNDWLLAGGTAEAAQTLLNETTTWLDHLLEIAQESEAEDDVRAIFRTLAVMDIYDVMRWREKTCKTLDIGKGEFDALLKATRREIGLGENGKPKYVVLHNRTVYRYYDRHGGEVLDILAHFAASIQAEIIEDDGSQAVRRFSITGMLPDGEALPMVEVTAKDFPSMNWVIEQWGSRALIEAGGATKDHLRAAIQLLSKDVSTRHIYNHIGWREINQQQVYLSMNGAVGYEGIEVRGTTDLTRYRLPTQPEDIKTAMSVSLKFWETGDYSITVPLWAAMFLAPLSSIIKPTFTLWVYGTTGSMKSTITALALCHFGQFAYNTPPASWTGTANALEKKAFLIKDAPLWIDDYVPQSTFSGNAELKRKVDQLLRDWGNRSGRSRMNADLSLRQTFAPRGLIVTTAEQLPPGRSIQARLFQIEVSPDMVTRGAGSPLTMAQTEEASLYTHAMGGYLLWLAEQYNELQETLPDKLLEYTEVAREKGAHLRMPMNVAQLFLGIEMGLRYAQHVGAIDVEQQEARQELGWEILVGLGEAQQIVATEENPVEMYLTAITEMLAQGSVYLKHRVYSEISEKDYPQFKNRQPNAEFLGWYGNDTGIDENANYTDSRYWYLIPGVTFKKVVEFYRGSGVVFPDSSRGIKAKLKEQNLLVPGKGRTFDYQFAHDLPRVLRIIKNIEDEHS